MSETPQETLEKYALDKYCRPEIREAIRAVLARLSEVEAVANRQSGRVELLEAERDTLRAWQQETTAQMLYIAGIVERGEGKPIPDDERVPQAILRYVKALEAERDALRRRVVEVERAAAEAVGADKVALITLREDANRRAAKADTLRVQAEAERDTLRADLSRTLAEVERPFRERIERAEAALREIEQATEGIPEQNCALANHIARVALAGRLKP
jgi:hypothetical protein